jgi:hypothetical protein
MRREQGAGPRYRDPEENRPARPIRDHGSHAVLDPGLAVRGGSREQSLSFPEPLSNAAAPLDAPIYARIGAWLRRERRPRRVSLRHPFDVPNEGGADQSRSRQPASGPAASWAYDAKEQVPDRAATRVNRRRIVIPSSRRSARPRAKQQQEAGSLTGRPSASSDCPLECARRPISYGPISYGLSAVSRPPRTSMKKSISSTMTRS